MTPAEGRRFKRDNARVLRAQQRVAARVELEGLREQLRQARARRRDVLRALPGRLRVHKLRARAERKELQARLIERMRRELEAQRVTARARRAADLETAKLAAEAVERARLKVEAERRYQAEMRRLEAANRDRKRQEKQIRKGRHEALSQSDDTVRGNIPPELAPMWERVKGRIKGSDRRSRTEAFLQYAEEHPGEVFATIESDTDAMIAEHERTLARRGRRAA